MKGENEKSKSPFFMYSYWGFWTREKREGRARREGNPCKEAIDLSILPTIYVCKKIAAVND